MDTLTAHAKEVLSVFAAATEPRDSCDVVESLLSAEPQIGWGSTRGRAFRAWLIRRNELHHAANILEVDGLLVTVPDVQGLVISESGRRALVEAVSD
jgi:hypothetical protein